MKTTWPAKPKTSTIRLCTEDGLTPGLDPLTLLAWSSFKVLGLWEGWGGLPLGAHGFQTAKGPAFPWEPTCHPQRGEHCESVSGSLAAVEVDGFLFPLKQR